MKLYTSRLLLTTLRSFDAGITLDFVIRNKERLQALEPKRDPAYYTRAGQAKFLSQDVASQQSGASLRLWMMPKGERKVIGSVSFYRILYGSLCSCMIGYRIDGDYEGKGLMREALNETVRFAFEEMGLHRIEAGILPHNTRSIALIERCGFKQEGLMRKAMEINGVWEDHVLYAVVKGDG